MNIDIDMAQIKCYRNDRIGTFDLGRWLIIHVTEMEGWEHGGAGKTLDS